MTRTSVSQTTYHFIFCDSKCDMRLYLASCLLLSRDFFSPLCVMNESFLTVFMYLWTSLMVLMVWDQMKETRMRHKQRSHRSLCTTSALFAKTFSALSISIGLSPPLSSAATVFFSAKHFCWIDTVDFVLHAHVWISFTRLTCYGWKKEEEECKDRPSFGW